MRVQGRGADSLWGTTVGRARHDMLYDAMDFASEADSLQGLSTTDMWQLPCDGEACVVGFVVWGQQATNQYHQSMF